MRSGEYLLVQALSLYTGDDDFSGFVRVRFLTVPCNPSRVADWLHTGHCEVSRVVSLYPVIPSLLSPYLPLYLFSCVLWFFDDAGEGWAIWVRVFCFCCGGQFWQSSILDGGMLWCISLYGERVIVYAYLGFRGKVLPMKEGS
jgi:hypothetical protein